MKTAYRLPKKLLTHDIGTDLLQLVYTIKKLNKTTILCCTHLE